MADTVAIAKNGSRVLGKILQRVARGAAVTGKRAQGSTINLNKLKQRVWVAASADPAVDSGSQAAYPVEIGDLAYRVDTDEAFICSVAPAAATAATFIQMHA